MLRKIKRAILHGGSRFQFGVHPDVGRSNRETRQLVLARTVASMNSLWVTLGSRAMTFKWIFMIVQPAARCSSVTVAVMAMSPEAEPASPNSCDSARENWRRVRRQSVQLDWFRSFCERNARGETGCFQRAALGAHGPLATMGSALPPDGGLLDGEFHPDTMLAKQENMPILRCWVCHAFQLWTNSAHPFQPRASPVLARSSLSNG